MSDQGTVHSPKPRFAKLPLKLLHDQSITDGAKVLYAHMRWRFGSNGKNFEGRSNMAKFLGVSSTTITNRIKELEAAGWIIVVERVTRNKGGNYQTPFYHVFERLKDSQLFREGYIPTASEVMREKPTVEPRKSRRGKGGNPKFKTSTTQVDRVNSDFPRADNSSSHYLDSVDLDSKDIPADADATPATTFDDLPPVDWSQPMSRQSRMVQAVYQVWGYPPDSWRNTCLEQMLRGVTTNDTYKIGNIPATYKQRFEPEELGDWHDWYMQSGVVTPDKVITESPGKIQTSIMQWIDAGKPKGKVKNTNPLAGFQEVI
jgi:hypothetical protein